LAVFDTENLRGNRAGIPSTLNYDTRFFYKEHLYKELEADGTVRISFLAKS